MAATRYVVGIVADDGTVTITGVFTTAEAATGWAHDYATGKAGVLFEVCPIDPPH